MTARDALLQLPFVVAVADALDDDGARILKVYVDGPPATLTDQLPATVDGAAVRVERVGRISSNDEQ